MKELIKAYEDALKISNNKYHDLCKHKDGFVYIARIRSYGSITHQIFSNPYILQLLCDKYNGEDGIVDVYTNNKKLELCNYGTTYTKTVKQLKKLAMKDISMSNAMATVVASLLTTTKIF